MTPFTTFYDSPETLKLTEAWQAAHPDQAAGVYFANHAGRYALLIELVRRLGITGTALDVGGIPMTQALFADLTPLSDVQLSPRVDLEMDPWAERAGVDTFDLVVFSEVVEHLRADPSHALHQINRSLHLGGHLLLTTVNVGSELGLHRLSRGEAPYAMPNLFGKVQDRHQREYAPKELQRLVAAHGFTTWASTVNVYPSLHAKRTAHQWAERELPGRSPELHGDTIVVIGRKVEESVKPRWLNPVYHDTVAENARDTVPDDVVERAQAELPADLADLFAYR